MHYLANEVLVAANIPLHSYDMIETTIGFMYVMTTLGLIMIIMRNIWYYTW